MTKNAGLKERSASEPTVPAEEAEPVPWLREQVPEGSGKLAPPSGLMGPAASCLVGGVQSHVLPIICAMVFTE